MDNGLSGKARQSGVCEILQPYGRITDRHYVCCTIRLQLCKRKVVIGCQPYIFGPFSNRCHAPGLQRKNVVAGLKVQRGSMDRKVRVGAPPADAVVRYGQTRVGIMTQLRFRDTTRCDSQNIQTEVYKGIAISLAVVIPICKKGCSRLLASIHRTDQAR
jgi:hypothetical protein